MIALYSVYLKPIEVVDLHLAAHREFLKPLYAKGVILCSGPQIPRTGGFILMNVAGKAEAMEIMKGDPYVVQEVAQYFPIEFDCRSYAEGFEKFLGK